MKKSLAIIFSVITIFTVLSLPIYAEPLNEPAVADEIMCIQKAFTENDGLLDTVANGICQTLDGYVWLAQFVGLTKSNGKNFTTYREMVDSETNELVSIENIKLIEADKDNCLFLGIQNKGLYVYNTVTQYFTSLAENISTHINNLLYYNDNIYAASDNGVIRVNCHNYSCSILEGTEGQSISAVAADNNVFYYVIGGQKCYLFADTPQEICKDYEIKSIFADNDTLYLGDPYGKVLKWQNNSFENYSIPENQAINVITKMSGNIIVGTDHGIFRLISGRLVKIGNHVTTACINDMIVDHENILWAVSDSGVYQIEESQFVNLYNSFNIYSENVNTCIVYKENLYVGGENGVQILNENTNTVIENNLSTTLKGIRIRGFANYQDKLYIAAYSSKIHGLMSYDGTTITDITPQEMLNDDTNADNISLIRKTRFVQAYQDLMVIGTNYGATIYKDGTFTSVKMDTRPLSVYRIENLLYFCTDGDGIHIYDTELKNHRLLPGTKNTTPLRVVKYEKLFLYSIGTRLYNFDEQTGTAQQVNLENSGSIVDLFIFNNNLYICSSSGFFIMHGKDALLNENSELIEKYDCSRGITAGISANGSLYYDEVNNRVYFNCKDGVYKFNPDGIVLPDKKVLFNIDSVYIDDTLVSDNTQLNLSQSATQINIYVDIITSRKYSDFSIYYKLNGLDKNYTRLDYQNNSSILINNPKGGDYTLEIYAQDKNGTCSEIKKIHIVKEKAFLEKTSSYIIIIGTIILVIGCIIFLLLFLKNRKYKAKEASLRSAMNNIMSIASQTIDAKDSYTNGHSIRVARYATVIAKEIGFDRNEMQNIFCVGLLHDIGKIGVPDNVLGKPGKLTDDEFSQIKKHPEIGNNIVTSVDLNIPHLNEGVLYHHEKYDGSGYPNHLSKLNIPLYGRIIACTDAYDAMSSTRCYRKAIPTEIIIGEFEKGKGRQFDPELADVTINCIKNGKFDAVSDITQPFDPNTL